MSESLKADCLRLVGSIRVVASVHDRSHWKAPALLTGMTIGGRSVDDLPRLMWSMPEVTTTDICEAWDAIVPLLNGRKGSVRPAVASLHRVFPLVPFAPVGDHVDVRDRAIQFLAVAAWHGGTLRLQRDAIHLRIGGARLGLDRQAVDWTGGRRRLRHPMPFTPEQCLRTQLGARMRGGRQSTGALHRYLQLSLPHRAAEITALFSAAVWAGAEAEAAVTQPFDVESERRIATRYGDKHEAGTSADVNRLLEMQRLIGHV